MELCSEQTVLVCEECKDELIVFGPEEDWRSRRAVFLCERGHRLALDGHAEEEILAAP